MRTPCSLSQQQQKGLTMKYIKWMLLPAAVAALAGCNVDVRNLDTVLHDKGWSSSDRQEAYRPQLHYTPNENWMNDPNGLVFFDGEYHLFYQYNPDGNNWGNMSWGHAVSTDLVHWNELPVAIPQQVDDNGTPEDAIDDRIEMIFSGSIVVDEDNRSGLGAGTDPVLLAYYTSAYNYDAPDRGRQAQSLAYSTDRGRTWHFHDNNPVVAIAPDNPDGYNANEFRDPKVFYYAPEDKWVMAVVLALDHQVQFYESTDLLNWTHLSDFGPANSDTGIWEVPDLFEVAIDGDSSNKKWVLALSVNGGTPYGGSGIQYFVGDFDGTDFTAENLTPREVDFGTTFENFESGFDGWDLQGDAFGLAPAEGGLKNRVGDTIQHNVVHYTGDFLINTYRRFDDSVGIATSPEFTISQPYINFLVGGGHHPHEDLPRAGVIGYPDGELFAAFDGTDWNGWTATGNAFTDGAGQDSKSAFDGWYDGIKGILGTSLMHSFHPGAGGDGATGTLTSPGFTIKHDYINFKVGGGYHPIDDANGATVIKLVVDGVTERWSTGVDKNELHWRFWDVSEFKGQDARIVIDDQHTGTWGQLQVDHILFSDETAPTVKPNATLIAGFDGTDYEGWTETGTAFDSKSASGGWYRLVNYLGHGLVHSFGETTGDAAMGTLTSAEFTIEKPYLNLLVGGGNKPAGHPDGEARIYLMIDGMEVASATGEDSNTLNWHSWNLHDYLGRKAELVISDQNTAQWGQILVDHIIATDTPVVAEPRGTVYADFESELTDWTATGSGDAFRVASDNRCEDGEDYPEVGFVDDALLNSFVCGQKDGATGTLTSPSFTVVNDYIHFKMGGGRNMRVEVLANGEVAAEYRQPENSWTLTWGTIDVSALKGQSVQLRFVDDNTGGWGFFLADQVVLSDEAETAQPETTAETAVNLIVNGDVVRTATGPNSGGLDWVAWNVSDLTGQTARLEVVDLSRDGWGHILVDDIRFAQQPARDAAGRADWVDWGKDFYAAITFFDYPGSQPAWLGWSNNWQYAGAIPTDPFKGTQSLVRTVGLTSTDDGLVLTQAPVGLGGLTLDKTAWRWPGAVTLSDESVTFNHQFEAGTLLDVELAVEPTTAAETGLRFNFSESDWVDVVYDRENGTLAVDRSESGEVGFHDDFPGVHAAPVELDEEGMLRVRIVLDWSMIEVFGQNGQANITDRVFPNYEGPLTVDVFARDGESRVQSLEASRLTSIWAD